MAPRPNWKGFLKLSLVSCAVAMYPATSTSQRARGGFMIKTFQIFFIAGVLLFSNIAGTSFVYAANIDHVAAQVQDLDSRIKGIEENQKKLDTKLNEVMERLDHLKVIVRRF
jgi:hypothetical protein